MTYFQLGARVDNKTKSASSFPGSQPNAEIHLICWSLYRLCASCQNNKSCLHVIARNELSQSPPPNRKQRVWRDLKSLNHRSGNSIQEQSSEEFGRIGIEVREGGKQEIARELRKGDQWKHFKCIFVSILKVMEVHGMWQEVVVPVCWKRQKRVGYFQCWQGRDFRASPLALLNTAAAVQCTCLPASCRDGENFISVLHITPFIFHPSKAVNFTLRKWFVIHSKQLWKILDKYLEAWQ